MLLWGTDGTVWHLDTAPPDSGSGALASDTEDSAAWRLSSLAHTGRIRTVHSNGTAVSTSANALVSIAIGDGGLLFRSEDQGTHWQPGTLSDGATEARAAPSWRELGRQTLGSAMNQQEIWLAASSEGLLARSRDGGQQWQSVQSWVAGRGVRALAPAQQGEWLVVDGQGTLWRSAQDASIWRSIPGVKPLQRLSRFADPQPEWWAATSDGHLLRSTDGGARWQPMADLKAPILGIQALPGTLGGRVAFGGAGQCRVRPTRSTPWRDCSLPEAKLIQSLAVNDQGQRWLASGEAGLLWTSGDQGRHWQRVDWPAQADNSRTVDAAAWDPVRQRFWVAGEGGLLMWSDRDARHWRVAHDGPREYVHDLASTGGQKLLASLSQRRLARSDNGGLSWRSHLFSQLLEPAYLFSVNVNAQGGVVVGGGQGSVMVAPDGEHWLAHSSGQGTAFLNALMLPDQRTVLLFGSGGVAARVDSLTGDREDLALPQNVAFYGGFTDPAHHAVILVGTSGWVLRSADGGLNWSAVQVGEQTLDVGGVSPDGRSVVVAGRKGALWRSRLDEQGLAVEWQPVSTPPEPGAPDTPPGWRFAQHDAAGQAWWLGNNRGHMLRSTDQGETWQWVQTGWTTTLRPPVYDPAQRRWWMPARDGGLLCSQDDGLSWTAVFSHTTEHLRGVWIDPRDGALVAYGARLVRLEPTSASEGATAFNDTRRLDRPRNGASP
jgi:photosystem II stability/assembly factor-like uncharacterized protein